MDLLNRAYAPLNDLLQSMTPGARITTGLLLIAVVVSFGYLFRYHADPADEFLFGGRSFSESEIAAMETAFAKKGLNGSRREGHRIRVPRRQRYEYLGALADDHALPANFNGILQEMVSSGSPFESRQAAETRMKLFVQRYMSLIISSMEGIEEAAVTLDEAEQGGLTRTRERRALVAAKASGRRELTPQQLENIRVAVAGGFVGLASDQVTVVDLNSMLTSHPRPLDGGLASGESAYTIRKRETEGEYRGKILDALQHIRGVVVQVEAKLSTEQEHTRITREIRDPKNLSSSDFEKTVSSSTPTGGGRPGAVPNAVLGNRGQEVASSDLARSETTERRTQQQAIAGETRSTIVMAPLHPVQVRAIVQVPMSYIEEVWRLEWRRANPGHNEEPPVPDLGQLRQVEQQQLQVIETQVAHLLPPREGEDPYPEVSVKTYTAVGVAAEPPAGITDEAASWLARYWPTLGMLLVAAASLWMLRGLLRAPTTQPEPTPAAAQLQEMMARGAAEGAAEQSRRENALKQMRVVGPNLQDELSELVKEDPDAAANVLRSWIGDAA